MSFEKTEGEKDSGEMTDVNVRAASCLRAISQVRCRSMPLRDFGFE